MAARALLKGAPMRRKFWMIVFGLGAVAGFSSGFAHLWRGPHHHSRHFQRHAEFERRLGEICTDRALRAWERRNESAGAQSP